MDSIWAMILPQVVGQWQAVLRWALHLAAGALIEHGLVTAGQAPKLETLAFTAAAALVSLGAGLWGVVAQHPQAIKAKAVQLEEQGK